MSNSKESVDAFKRMLDSIAECQSGHQLKQVGSCVYCVDCNKRLYEGTIPEGNNSSPSDSLSRMEGNDE